MVIPSFMREAKSTKNHRAKLQIRHTLCVPELPIKQLVVSVSVSVNRTVVPQNVKRFAFNGMGDSLYYWKDDPSGTDMAVLLDGGDGNCISWAQFFLTCVRTQGIGKSVDTSQHPYVGKIYEVQQFNRGLPWVRQNFYVKNWDEVDPDGTPTRPAQTPPGIPGQNMPTPDRLDFYEHYVTAFNGQATFTNLDAVYDAPYGKKIFGTSPPGPQSPWFKAEYNWSFLSLAFLAYQNNTESFTRYFILKTWSDYLKNPPERNTQPFNPINF